jgi:hypothetical protein
VRPAPANNEHAASEGGGGEIYGIDFLLDLVTSSLMRLNSSLIVMSVTHHRQNPLECIQFYVVL